MYLTHGRGRDQHRSTRQRSLAATELRLCIASDHRALSDLVLYADLARYCRHGEDRNPTRSVDRCRRPTARSRIRTICVPRRGAGRPLHSILTEYGRRFGVSGVQAPAGSCADGVVIDAVGFRTQPRAAESRQTRR
jgi:hypothetical protein